MRNVSSHIFHAGPSRFEEKDECLFNLCLYLVSMNSVGLIVSDAGGKVDYVGERERLSEKGEGGRRCEMLAS